MESHLVGPQAVDLAFGHGDALEDGHCLLFDPVGEVAISDQLSDLSKGASVLMRVGMTVRVGVAMGMRLFSVAMIAGEVHVELNSFQARFMPARDVQVTAFQPQLLQLLLQLAGLDAQVNQRGDEHVAADAAEQVEV